MPAGSSAGGGGGGSSAGSNFCSSSCGRGGSLGAEPARVRTRPRAGGGGSGRVSGSARARGGARAVGAASRARGGLLRVGGTFGFLACFLAISMISSSCDLEADSSASACPASRRAEA